MSGAEAEAAYKQAPRSGKVIRLPITTTMTRYEIPPDWAGLPCDWIMYGADGDVAFGISTVSVTLNAESTLSTEAIVVNAATGMKLKDGVEDSFVMPSIVAGATTHFAVDGSAAGTLQITLKGGM